MKNNFIQFLLIISVFMFSCQNHSVPKQRGYLRIDMPETHRYKPTSVANLFSFEASEHAVLESKGTGGTGEWFNINYPRWNGTVYLSYFHLNDTSLQLLSEDARRFAYKHAVKASAIDESRFSFPLKRVHGMLYDVGGNTASSTQFFATDSLEHFLMGSLYFNSVPNRDSLSPVIDFVRADILHLIETLEWNN